MTTDVSRRSVLAVTASAAALATTYDAKAQAAGDRIRKIVLISWPQGQNPQGFQASQLIAQEWRKLGLEVEVLGEKALEKLGFRTLLAVGQGSVRESQVVIMKWNGGKKGDQPIAFVGKGVTFDTGGISLKPGPGMDMMKWDMGGAGAVAGAASFALFGGFFVLIGIGLLLGGIKGTVGADVSPEQAKDGARMCGVNLLAQMSAALDGDLERVVRVVKLGGFVQAGPDFTAIPAVINGCSDMMVEVFGDAGKHARSAVGVYKLPLGFAVEIDAIVEIR